MHKPALRTAVILFLCLGLGLPGSTQLNKLKQKIKIPVKAPAVPDLNKLLQEEPPVSTSLEDAIYDIPFLDAYNPDNSASAVFLPLTPEASFPLVPGLWEGTFQSFCLHAGTYAPGKGDGYVLATLKGKQSDIVASILKNSAYHPEISQENIQLLLWAVISRSKLSECSKEIQDTARVLLTQKEFDRLNGGAIGKIPQPVLNAVLEKMPPLARDIFHAEARLREMLVSPVLAPYHEVESVAVRVGEVLPPPDSREISWGRWNYNPDGYFIRYFPRGYSTTRIQLYYPEDFAIESDENGLITAISDRQGMKISVVYDTEIEPLRFSGDDNMAGIAFKELILSWTEPNGAEKIRSIKNAGWVLVGVPAGGGKPEAAQLQRFPDAADRYKFAVSHCKEVLELKTKLTKINPALKQIPDSAVWSVISLGNYCQALKLAISGAGVMGKSGEIPASLPGLPYRAWMKALHLLFQGELEESVGRLQSAVGEKSFKEMFAEYSDRMPEGGFYDFLPDGISTAGEETAINESKIKGPINSGAGMSPEKAALRRELPEYFRMMKEMPKPKKQTGSRKLGSSRLQTYKPDKNVAQPGNAGKQRLGQSARKSSSDSGRQSAENTRKMVKWFSRGTSAGSFAVGKLVGPGAVAPYAVPKAAATYTIGRTVGLWGECIDAISMDPPRSDYTVLARPEPGTFTPVRAEGGVTRARAEAINALLAACVDLTARLRAARFSVERYSGAMQAGDEEWARRQLENAIRYEKESGLAMMVVADRLEALTRLAQSEGIPDVMITKEKIENYLASIRAQGFAPEELEVCRALNLTVEEIEEMKNEILSGRELEGPASLYESARELVSALRDFARLLVTLPGVH